VGFPDLGEEDDGIVNELEYVFKNLELLKLSG
jgi:hypothetical protein